LANGNVIELTDSFFYKLFGVENTGGKTLGESILAIVDYVLIHVMTPAIVIFAILIDFIPFLVNIFLSNKAIFVFLHGIVVHTMVVSGAFLKNAYMSVFNQNANTNETILSIVSTIMMLSIVFRLIPFIANVLQFFNKTPSIFVLIIIFLLVLFQIVISFLMIGTAVSLVIFFLIFYSLFSVLLFSNSSKTMQLSSLVHLHDIPNREETIFDVPPPIAIE
jgi:hypothetical protein